MSAKEQDWTDVYREGGAWLGAARSHIQCKVPNGERVIWGSLESVHTTVRVLEEIAARAAAAERAEQRATIRDLKAQLETARKEALHEAYLIATNESSRLFSEFQKNEAAGANYQASLDLKAYQESRKIIEAIRALARGEGKGGADAS